VLFNAISVFATTPRSLHIQIDREAGYHIFHDVEYLGKSFIPSLKLIRDQYTRVPSCKGTVKAVFESREEYQPELKIDIDPQNLEEQCREIEPMLLA
jgi:hypothetical protein